MRLAVFAPLMLAAACGDNIRENISISAPDAWAPALTDFVAITPYGGLSFGTDGDFQISIVDDAAVPLEGYQLAADPADGDAIVVHAHDVLGAQYGAAAALEQLGFRFRHPYDPYQPYEPAVPATLDTAMHAPQIRVRGFQLHTLHPIEPYFAFWEPSAGNTADAHRIIDWVVKNRGNFLQWVALDDIMDPARHEAWKAFTAELIDYAHERGIRVGLNIQLFGQSNLQNAFDLSDDQTGTVPIHDEIAARLPLITDGLPFDVYDLSFGEFFDAEAQRFVDSVNEVAAQLRTFAPQAEMHATVHVGGTQRVTYMGEDIPYYFLVKFADPSIVPDIHSVMFYNLFEGAHGAYQQSNFDEHKAYLEARMTAGQKVAYFPEDAYWVAFDDSVPMMLPLYVGSRWLDLSELRADAGVLDEHLLFSSGWEWNYWLHDVAALRASYELPAAPRDLIADAYAPDLGAGAADVVEALSELQHDDLMIGELMPYLSGRDAVIDAGRTLGIVSQPDRITLDDLVAGGDRAVVQDAMDHLADYMDHVLALKDQLAALDLPQSRWRDEIRDGLAIDALRAHFVIVTYSAVLSHLSGDDAAAAGSLEIARADLDEAQQIVTSRHADLHDTHDRRLLDATPNHTFYQFGYLQKADTLCYWQREYEQADAILGDASAIPPACVF